MNGEAYTYVPKPDKQPHFARVKAFFKRHRKLSIVLGAILLLLVSGTATFALLYQKPVETKPVAVAQPAPQPKPVVYYSPLTGMKVKDEATTKLPVTGVMIENSPDARPQSGLKDAGVVYEAIAEGGITRFMALYQEAKPQLIGPVRSVRQYDLDWLRPYNAGLAHVGGSAAALKIIRSGNPWRDLDQFFNGSYYWRSTDRYAPHNVYTSFQKLDALNKAKGYTTSSFTGFTRTDGAPAAKPDATQIAINFSSALFNTAYTYNPKANNYTRYQAGAVHNDREKGAITPTVVVAMHVNESTIMQDGYRESITTSGSGKATVFQNGTAEDATWHKADQASQLYFTDDSGKVIALDRGQTWIAAVPNNEGSVSWK